MALQKPERKTRKGVKSQQRMEKTLAKKLGKGRNWGDV